MRPTLNIFLFPFTRPCFTGMGQSVGKLFFFTSQIGNPLNLIVCSKSLSLEATEKMTKLFVSSRPIIAKCRSKVFCNTFDLHLALICLNDLCCVYL